MKKTLFLSFLFSLLGMSLTFAQETDFNGDADFSEEEFRQKVDSVFQYMEYQGVDTGILIEHGFNFLNPRVFNGQNPDSVYSNKDILKTLYAGLYVPKVNNELSLEIQKPYFQRLTTPKTFQYSIAVTITFPSEHSNPVNCILKTNKSK